VAVRSSREIDRAAAIQTATARAAALHGQAHARRAVDNHGPIVKAAAIDRSDPHAWIPDFEVHGRSLKSVPEI
jgi:hypothetical protein